MHQELGGNTARTAGPGWPKGCPTPCGVMLSNKAGVKKEEGEDVWSDGVCLPKKMLCVMIPAFLEVSEHLPGCGK